MARNPDSIKEEQLAAQAVDNNLAQDAADATNQATMEQMYSLYQNASPFSTTFGGTAPGTLNPYNPVGSAQATANALAPAADNSYSWFAGAPTYDPTLGNPLNNTPFTSATPTGTSSAGSSNIPSGNTPTGNGTPAAGTLAEANMKIALGILAQYNITGLADSMAKIRAAYPEADSAQMMDLLRYDNRFNAGYKARFAANDKRAAAGLPMLDEKTYLNMEQGYKKLFTSYSLDTFANQSQYDNLIANDVSVAEAQTRVSLAYDTVLHGDPNTLKAFSQYYPQLSTSDLVATVLDPKTQLPAMQKKVQSAEIGGAAIAQGLNASAAAASIATQRYSNVTAGTIGSDVLQAQGLTKAQAQAGYEAVAGELPTAEKLSAIYGGQLDQYGQVQSEQANLQGLASAKRKKEALVNREVANFGGQTGQLQSAYGINRTAYGTSAAGLV